MSANKSLEVEEDLLACCVCFVPVLGKSECGQSTGVVSALVLSTRKDSGT